MFLFQCVHLNKINIVTDKPIPLEYLQPLKDKIELITFFIDNKTKKEDIKQFEELGKPLNLLSKIFKSSNQKELDNLSKFVEKINHIEQNYSVLKDEEFQNKTAELKKK